MIAENVPEEQEKAIKFSSAGRSDRGPSLDAPSLIPIFHSTMTPYGEIQTAH
ncbi:hypothetical protein ACWGH8_40025 [Nonomuraea muscovyensis]